MKHYKLALIALFMANALTTIGCKEEGTGWTPDMISDDPIVETPDDKVDISNIHTFKAPMSFAGKWLRMVFPNIRWT